MNKRTISDYKYHAGYESLLVAFWDLFDLRDNITSGQWSYEKDDSGYYAISTGGKQVAFVVKEDDAKFICHAANMSVG